MATGAKAPTSESAIVATAAQPFVADLAASCAFFTQKLGFSLVFVYGDPPFYAQVRRGGGRLNLRCVDDPVVDPGRRDRESLLAADLAADTYAKLDGLFREFQAAGVEFFQTLRREPWGVATFIIRDPDGNLLLFAGPGA